jgi:SAM-dependent methyltransferase
MSTDGDLRLTFDTAAAGYHDARPDYPEQIFAGLLDLTGVNTDARLLEIGCGPGKATMPLARLGFAITALEIGSALAEQAQQRLAEFPRVKVITSAFERWQPAPQTHFDLAYAATAWHWIDPAVRHSHAAAVIKPGGHLAVWSAGHAFPAGFDPFFTEIQSVYEQLGEPRIPWPPPEPRPDLVTGDAMEASGHFDSIQRRHYLWPMQYDAESYIALLNTFSGHIAMDPAKRDILYSQIRQRLRNRADRLLTREWQATLTVGRRT